MFTKAKIKIATLLFFAPLVLGIIHRIGKEGLILARKNTNKNKVQEAIQEKSRISTDTTIKNVTHSAVKNTVIKADKKHQFPRFWGAIM